MSGLTGCVVVAAGLGARLGAGVAKGLVEVGGRSLVQHAVEAVVSSGAVDVVVVVAPADARDVVAALLPDVIVVPGGATRQASVQAGLVHLPAGVDVVLVHDAGRALAPPSLVADVVTSVRTGHPAVVPGVAVSDSLRRLGGAVADHSAAVDREALVAVQTPQGFARALLDRAHTSASDAATDDATLVERVGAHVRVVPGHDDAFKVTRPLDLLLAEAVLARRRDGMEV